MIFSYTWEWLLKPSPAGELKTQTRRIVKPEPAYVQVGGNYAYDVVLPYDVGFISPEEQVIEKVSTEYYTHGGWLSGDYVVETSVNHRTKYEVGQTYAVQPGRGKPTIWWRWSDMTGTGCEYWLGAQDKTTLAHLPNLGWKPLRIRITDIRREDVRTISEEDAHAEGFASPAEFWLTWCSMHDKPACTRTVKQSDDKTDNVNFIREQLLSRPAESYQAWALTFEAVR